MFRLKRGVIRYKRAEGRSESLSWIAISELILISIVFISFLVFMGNVNDNTLFEKRAIARDLSLLVNTIQSVPGNTFYVYRPSEHVDYGFEFIDNQVIISEEKYGKLGYPFFENMFIPFHQYNVLNVPDFSISKFNNVLVISPEKRFGLAKDLSLLSSETHSLGYDMVNTSSQSSLTDLASSCKKADHPDKISLNLIMIDAYGIDALSTSPQTSQQLNSQVNSDAGAICSSISEQLFYMLKTPTHAIIRTSAGEMPDTAQRISTMPKDAALVLTIALGIENVEKNNIYIYVPASSANSNILACLIQEEISLVYPSITTSVIGISQSDKPIVYANIADQNSPDNRLNVMLVIGNAAITDNPLYKDTGKISLAIKNALNRYEHE